VGVRPDPLGFKPRHLCTWSNRFDDPERVFRCLYCSRDRLTALRETLQDLRADTRAIAEFQRLFARRTAVASAVLQRRAVSLAWRRAHVLASARIESEGPLVDLEDPALRRALEAELAPVLAAVGVHHLDLSELRGRERRVTQHLARHLFATRGAAGVVYRSHLDDRRCLVLFEGRGRLVADRDPIPLSEPLRALRQVCAEYGLELERSAPGKEP
jgi:hypothetical protein